MVNNNWQTGNSIPAGHRHVVCREIDMQNMKNNDSIIYDNHCTWDKFICAWSLQEKYNSVEDECLCCELLSYMQALCLPEFIVTSCKLKSPVCSCN